MNYGLETKFARFDGVTLSVCAAGSRCGIEGYASYFDVVDRGGDIVARGAYARSLKELAADGRRVKMLWQHDPVAPIGVWDEVHEDETGLWVKGHILTDVVQGREAAALLRAHAIDGLSIGYRTLKAAQDDKGRKLLQELELWEVSLVTFPMLSSARASASQKQGGVPRGDEATLGHLARALDAARAELAG